MQAADILDFWASIGKDGWWKKDDELDQQIVARFSDLHSQAANGELESWTQTGDGALAVIIILDQFSRNSPKAFDQDPQAISIAKTAIDSGLDKSSREDLRVFFYLPFEHSESILDQHQAVLLVHSVSNDPDYMKAVLEHREIIQRFGRFPHRNAVLGRHTTPAERAYLESGGFRG